MSATDTSFPAIRRIGLDGLIVSFGAGLSEQANRAALAFRAAIDREAWEGVEETSTSLVSVFLRFDPLGVPHAAMTARLQALLASRDWMQADLPRGRRLFFVPTVYGGAHGPQLEEAAARAGLTPGAAIASLSGARVRVQTIGFAPGQPYLGVLPDCWDIPRQQDLTPRVPVGALVVAIRQLVLFSVSTPTGWRHVGQTAARLFRPEAEEPFLLRPGDEVEFPTISPEKYERMTAAGQDGIRHEALP